MPKKLQGDRSYSAFTIEITVLFWSQGKVICYHHNQDPTQVANKTRHATFNVDITTPSRNCNYVFNIQRQKTHKVSTIIRSEAK